MYKLIAMTMLLGGCVAQPLATTAEPDLGRPIVPPVSGIYDVTVATATGDCQPPSVSGPLPPMQQAIVAMGSGALRVQMPDATTGEVATSATRDLLGYKWQQSFDSCGARAALDITAISLAADAMTLVRSELWSGTAGARQDVDGGSDAACDVLPAKDCGSSVTIRYQLAQACPLPCQIVLAPTPGADGAPAISCICSDGGSD